MMQQIADFLLDILWSNPLFVLVICVGIFYTVITRGLQIRKLKDMIFELKGGSSAAETGLSSYEAFALSIAGRVGTGNITGVATAIVMGGPGSVFWMWLIAMVGAATSFAECTLAQLYKEEAEGEYRGGSAYYIAKGLKNKYLGGLFAVAITFCGAVLVCGVQSNSIALSIEGAFGINKMITGAVTIALLAVVIFGGAKRIGRVAGIIVPIMSIIYIGFALIIIVVNIGRLPAVISMIFSSAFGMDALLGGMFGSAVSYGVRRGVNSNEAGQGTATSAAAAADVSHPVKQGLVQSLSVYIDTLLVCTATAFMILMTNSFNVITPEGVYLINNVGEVPNGPIFTQMAIDTIFPFGSAFVAIALFFFAFTTMMQQYHYCEINMAYFFRKRYPQYVKYILRGIFLISSFYGAIRTADVAWTYGDVGLGMIVWLNIVCLIFLYKPVLKLLKDYEDQRKKGLDPIFDPRECGIADADLWISISERYQQQKQASAKQVE